MTELTDNSRKFNEDEAIRGLDHQVLVHKKYLEKESFLSNAVSQAWGGDSESLDKLTKLQTDIQAAKQKGDKTEVTRLAQQAAQVSKEDLETLVRHEKYSGYGTGALKAVGLFARGVPAATLCIGTYSLDQMRMGQDARTNFQDGVLGGVKGFAMQRLFEKVGQGAGDPFAKGVTLGFSSQFVDNVTNRDNYKGSDAGSLAAGLGTGLLKSFDPKTLAATGLIFAGGAQAFKFTEGITGGAIANNALYRTMLTGTSFGMAGGAVHEIQRQAETPGEKFDLGKIIKSSLIQGGMDTIAAVPGGMQARAMAAPGSQSSIAKIEAETKPIDRAALAREYQARFGDRLPFGEGKGPDSNMFASRRLNLEGDSNGDRPTRTAEQILAGNRPDYVDVLAEAPKFARMKAVRWLGQGNESAAIEVAPTKNAPDGAALKVTLPEGGWQYEWGHRSFDAKLIGKMHEVDVDGVHGNVYLQELVETRDHYPPEDINRIMRKIEDAGLEFADPGADPNQQFGYSRATGKLVLIDYAAVDKKGANETHQAIIGGAERVEAEYDAEMEARRNGKQEEPEELREGMESFDIDIELRRQEALAEPILDSGKRAILKSLFMGDSVEDAAIGRNAESNDWSDAAIKRAKAEAKEMQAWARKRGLLERK